MYVVFSVLLTLAFAVLTVYGETKRGRQSSQMLFFANVALSAVGLFLLAGTFFVARTTVLGGNFDAEFSEWAWDMLTVYYQLSLVPFAVFLGITAIALVLAMAEGNRRPTRYGDAPSFKFSLCLAAAVVFSVVMLLLAPMYAFMTVNESIALENYVLLTGIGESLLLRAPLLIEYGIRMRRERRTS